MKVKLEKSLQMADFHENMEKTYDHAFLKLDEDDEMGPMLNFLKNDLSQFSDFRYIQLYFEQVLPEFTKNHLFWEIYVAHCENMCQSSDAKLDIFRRALKNCNQISQFWILLI